MEQNKQERTYELTSKQRMAIVDCYDNKETKAINVDPVRKLISVINTESNEVIEVLGGINIPTMISILKLLETNVTSKQMRYKRKEEIKE